MKSSESESEQKSSEEIKASDLVAREGWLTTTGYGELKQQKAETVVGGSGIQH